MHSDTENDPEIVTDEDGEDREHKLTTIMSLKCLSKFN